MSVIKQFAQREFEESLEGLLGLGESVICIVTGEDDEDDYVPDVADLYEEPEAEDPVCSTTGRRCQYGSSFNPCSDFCDGCLEDRSSGFSLT